MSTVRLQKEEIQAYKEREQIKVVVMEPETLPHVERIRNKLETFQRIVGGYIETVTPFRDKRDVVCLCNEEGRLMDLPLNFYTDVHQPIVGNVIFLEVGIDGDFISLSEENIRFVLDKFR